MRKIVIWGAGDQGRVNKPILDRLGMCLAAMVDDTPDMVPPFPEVPLLQGLEAFLTWLTTEKAEELSFVIAIGNPYGHVRRNLHQKLVSLGLSPFSLIDPTAIVSAGAVLGRGIQMMPFALVHVDAVVGDQCIINTRATVEHDCVLADGVEIGPGATLCGRVHIGRDTWIGAGATILPRLFIGANSIIGAGTVVTRDIPDNVVVAGNPAKVLRSNSIRDSKHG